VKLTELVVTLALTTGTAGTMSGALDVPALEAGATAVAARVDCRTVDTAVAAFVAEHDTVPVRITDIRPYLRGDLTGYGIVAGAAVGPGCGPAER
jgi:hypothetical protein